MVPREVRHCFKSIAFKFYEHFEEYRLRRKMSEFKTLVLVLRGRNVDHVLEQVYDREKLRFITDLGNYDATPQALFLTNQVVLEPLLDFILTTRIIKLYTDFSKSYEHLMDSPVFSYLLNHNVEKISQELIIDVQRRLERNYGR